MSGSIITHINIYIINIFIQIKLLYKKIIDQYKLYINDVYYTIHTYLYKYLFICTVMAKNNGTLGKYDQRRQ